MESRVKLPDPTNGVERAYFEELYVDDRAAMVITELDRSGQIVDEVRSYPKMHRSSRVWESEQERREWFATHDISAMWLD